MGKIEFSLRKEEIAQYEDEESARHAAELARGSNMMSQYRFILSYSPRASRWLVSVRDQHGNMMGYLHPIIEE